MHKVGVFKKHSEVLFKDFTTVSCTGYIVVLTKPDAFSALIDPFF